MKPFHFSLFAIASILVLLPGCADLSLPVGTPGIDAVKVSGVGQNVSASHPGQFDLWVSGHGNTVQVPAGCSIRRLWVSGAKQEVTVSSGSSVQSIRLSGVGSTIHLPKNVHPMVHNSGVDNRILNDRR